MLRNSPLVRRICALLLSLSSAAFLPASTASAMLQSLECADRRSGLSLEDLHEQVFALSSSHAGSGDSHNRPSHVGNAVFMRKIGSDLEFATARHVIDTACDRISAGRANHLFMNYENRFGSFRSEPFSIDGICTQAQAAEQANAIDIHFFKLPTAHFAGVDQLRDTPIVDNLLINLSDVQYFGYSPWPHVAQDNTRLVLMNDRRSYALPHASARGWSGAPVFRRIDDRYFLSGILTDNANLRASLDNLQVVEGPVSDYRIGQISAVVLRDLVSNGHSLVMPLSRFNVFSEEVDEPSFIGSMRDLSAVLDVYSAERIREAMKRLSSHQQFDSTSYFVNILKGSEADRLERGLLVALYASQRDLCYSNEILSELVFSELDQRLTSFAAEEIGAVINAIGVAQDVLATSLTQFASSEQSEALIFADRIFSLIYSDYDQFELRDELLASQLPDRFWSNVVYDHGRLKMNIDADMDSAVALFRRAIDINETNALASWALADTLVSERYAIGEALDLYTRLLAEDGMRSNLNEAQIEIIERGYIGGLGIAEHSAEGHPG
jgi:hypothetical protein